MRDIEMLKNVTKCQKCLVEVLMKREIEASLIWETILPSFEEKRMNNETSHKACQKIEEYVKACLVQQSACSNHMRVKEKEETLRSARKCEECSQNG